MSGVAATSAAICDGSTLLAICTRSATISSLQRWHTGLVSYALRARPSLCPFAMPACRPPEQPAWHRVAVVTACAIGEDAAKLAFRCAPVPFIKHKERDRASGWAAVAGAAGYLPSHPAAHGALECIPCALPDPVDATLASCRLAIGSGDGVREDMEVRGLQMVASHYSGIREAGMDASRPGQCAIVPPQCRALESVQHTWYTVKRLAMNLVTAGTLLSATKPL